MGTPESLLATTTLLKKRPVRFDDNSTGAKAKRADDFTLRVPICLGGGSPSRSWPERGRGRQIVGLWVPGLGGWRHTPNVSLRAAGCVDVKGAGVCALGVCLCGRTAREERVDSWTVDYIVGPSCKHVFEGKA